MADPKPSDEKALQNIRAYIRRNARKAARKPGTPWSFTLHWRIHEGVCVDVVQCWQKSVCRVLGSPSATVHPGCQIAATRSLRRRQRNAVPPRLDQK